MTAQARRTHASSRGSPLVSVAMVAYNAERFISESIEGVLAQTHSNLELVVIDDGSQDETATIVRAFSGADPRVRLHELPVNRGIPIARAASLELAQGTYFAINDSDDISRPDRLERQVELLESNPDVALCGSNLTIIGESGQPVGYRTYPESSSLILRRALRTCPVHNSSACARTESLRAIGGYDTGLELCEDYDLWLRLLSTQRAVNIQEALVSYRLSSDQSIQRRLKPLMNSAQAVRRRWLLQPRYRSIDNLLWYCGVEVLRRLPDRVVLNLYASLFIRQKNGDLLRR